MKRSVARKLRLSGRAGQACKQDWTWQGKEIVLAFTVVGGWGWGEGSLTRDGAYMLELHTGTSGGSTQGFSLVWSNGEQRGRRTDGAKYQTWSQTLDYVLSCASRSNQAFRGR